METNGEFIVVNFASVGKKQLNLQLCLDKGLIEAVMILRQEQPDFDHDI